MEKHIGCLISLLVTSSLLSISFAFVLPSETFGQCVSRMSGITTTNISQILYTPNDPSYTSVLHSSIQNLMFNSSVTSKPGYIVTPRNELHVQASVACARKNGLQLRIRSGGHDYEGLSFTSYTAFVIIDLVNLRKVHVNVQESTAWVESGAILAEVFYHIAIKSNTLAFPAGFCTTLGVGGQISGGGQGNLVRKYGLSSDNVVDARIVNAQGKILDRSSMGEELFWAIRGGGGASFGVILAWKIKLVPVPPIVTVFNAPRTLKQGAIRLVQRWQEIAPKLDPDLYIRVLFLGVEKNDTQGGKTKTKTKTPLAIFNSLFLGPKNKLLPLITKSFPQLGLKAVECLEMTWIESVLYFYDEKSVGKPIEVLLDRNFVTKGYFKAKSDFVKEPIPENGLLGLSKFLSEDQPSIVILDPFGGRMSEIGETETAFPYRAGILYNVQYLVKWYTVDGAEAIKGHIDWISRLYNYMTPYVSKSPRSAYLNYRDLDLGRNERGNATYAEAIPWGTKYFGNNFKQLALVKAMVDPDNFFQNEQSIPVFTS